MTPDMVKHGFITLDEFAADPKQCIDSTSQRFVVVDDQGRTVFVGNKPRPREWQKSPVNSKPIVARDKER